MPFRVLLVCPKPPFPPIDGGTRAVAELATGLAGQGHSVHVLAMATRKHPDLGGTPPAGVVQEAMAVDTRPGSLTALESLVSDLPLSVSRLVSPAFARRLQHLLADPTADIVQFEGLKVAPYQPLARGAAARVVFRAHNVEADLWRQRAAASRWPLSAWLTTQAERVARLETDAWRTAHAVAAISPAVANACSAVTAAPVIDLPVGFAVPHLPPPISTPVRLFHLGAMDWEPTADGVAWFLAEAWPRVLARHPQAVLHLAGRHITRFAEGRSARNVVCDGEVEDADAYVRGGGVLVAPIRSGSGLRVKVVEAMAQGRAVITTAAGADGLGCVPGEHLLIGDDAHDMAEQVLRCLTEPGLVGALGAAAHRLAAARFERGVVTTKLVDLYASLMATARPETHAVHASV
jgi:glycosyltransferase involved in cell wall biosynthesis